MQMMDQQVRMQMNKSEVKSVIAGVLWVLLFFGAGYYAGSRMVKKEAVERGYAEYERTTGDWQWKK